MAPVIEIHSSFYETVLGGCGWDGVESLGGERGGRDEEGERDESDPGERNPGHNAAGVDHDVGGRQNPVP